MTHDVLKKPKHSILLAAALVAACAPDFSDPQAGTVDANGITIAYESDGPREAATILLVCGTGMQLVDWPAELVDALVRRGYRVVRFDNRDVGLSTHLDSAGVPDAAAIERAAREGRPLPLPYTISDMTRDALGLLDALGIARAHVVGVSQGGMIAQVMAIEHPDRVLSLTSIMAGAGNPDRPLPARPEAFADLGLPPRGDDFGAAIDYEVRMFRVLESPAYRTDEHEIRQHIERSYRRSYDPAALTRQQTAALVASYTDRRNALRNVRVPTVVIHGAEDPLVPVDGGRDVAESIPGAELRVIPGMGHDLPAQLVPAIVNGILTAAARASGATPEADASADSHRAP